MKKGLVIGKFMPLHNGHIHLIDYALLHCDSLIIAIVVKPSDSIPVDIRLEWLEWLKETRPCIEVRIVDEALPHTETLQEDAARIWIDFFKRHFADINVIISSEHYGDMLAKAMSIEHIYYDVERLTINISGQEIRKCPSKNLEFVPEIVRNYLLKHEQESDAASV